MRLSLVSARRRRSRPPLILGVLVAAVCLAAETLAGVLLSRAVPVQTLGVLYLVGLLLVASVWGILMGFAMAVASTIVFDYFLLPPAGSLRLTRHQDLAILAVFMALALLACALARVARLLSAEVENREEAVLSADLARLLLRAPDLDAALPAAARRLARALGLRHASIEPGEVSPDGGRQVIPLHGDNMSASLCVPAGLPRPVARRLERVAPSLEVLLEAARERQHVGDALRQSRDELARIAQEQAGLRRLATLVAHAAPSSQVFDAVAREMGLVLGARHAMVIRYEPGGSAVTVGAWNRPGGTVTMPVGHHWRLEEGTVSELVYRTGVPGRINAYVGEGPLSDRLRARGIFSSVGCPIMVGRSLWGVALASSSTPQAMPPSTEVRMMEFTELAAAAIANTQTNADLKASRARVVAAADEARRRIERDLHDGTQQRLISIGLDMRSVEDAVPPELEDLRLKVAHTAKSLDEAIADLQEISRGLHPAIVARGGLQPALTMLARRSAVPVELDLSLHGRLEQRVEVTVYYVVSEALTNAAKHAFASVVYVRVAVGDGVLRLTVRDDGVGGADFSCGSGLVGLSDRVEALGGTLSVASPISGGTILTAELPVGP